MKTCHAIVELEVEWYGATCNIAYVAHFELTKFRARMLRKEEGLQNNTYVLIIKYKPQYDEGQVQVQLVQLQEEGSLRFGMSQEK